LVSARSREESLPGVSLRAKTPLNSAGILIDLPTPVPMPIVLPRSANSALSPPEEPPHERFRFFGVQSLAGDVVVGFNIEERLRGTGLAVEDSPQGQQLSGDLTLGFVSFTGVFDAHVASYPAHIAGGFIDTLDVDLTFQADR
jgi:hypothetical protein